ncbi:MAG: hypothetical protein IBV52_09000 [Candidatus Bathyarchaeota archaeon]
MRGLMLRRIIRFRRCSKGVSTVIGTIFLVLIALTVATNVFLWTFTQNANYNQAVKESSQRDADLSSERIVAYNTVYSVFTGNVEVTTTMTAQGPLSAQIITVWVTWTVENNTKYGSETVNITLTPGDTITKTIPVPVSGALDVDGEFNGWLVTARGNRVPLELKKVETITIADVSLGIGAISMNFTNFKYYNVTNDDVLDNYPTGASGYDVNQPPKQEYPGIAFQVTITNFDLENRSISLSSSSLLWMLFPTTEQSIRGAMWYIVNVNDGIIANTFTPIIIAHNSQKTLYFASATDASGGFTPCLSGYGGTAAVNLALIGQIAGSPYGQNLPFVSIHITTN